jgi:hypothetical protein
MALTHSELMAELMPMYQQEPSRFMQFYDKVYMLLLGIPEGGVLRIRDHFRERALDMFMKVASLLIIEEINKKAATDDLLEFSDDYTTIRRMHKFIPSRPYRRGRRSM